MIDKVQDKCTACGACYSICPVNSIHMNPDDEGFLRPVIDMHTCTECNLCEKVCPVLGSRVSLNTDSPMVFAAWSHNNKIRMNSTSGGVFSELAQQIISNGGHVVGARYKSDFTVEHVFISNMNELKNIRQSKYVQSDMQHICRDIKTLLTTGNSVLFCGTPCQASGLLCYLGRTHENLYVCDFICRGVTSPMVYKMYLEDLEKKFCSPIETIQFKNKNIGWNQFCTLINFKNGVSYQKDRYQDSYMYGYLNLNLYLRRCCYECDFKGLPRSADISLGDFWGIGKTRPHLDANKGTSLVMLNTEKGRELFLSCGKNLVTEECTIKEALAGNSAILQSAPKSKYRKEFFIKLRKSKSFIMLIDTYRNKRNSTARIRHIGLLIKKCGNRMGLFCD